MKRVLSLIAFLLLSLLLLSILQPGTSSAQPERTSKGCPILNVLLLVDQSSSLRTTDPGALRVDGAESLIKSLSNSAQVSGERINLGIAGFGEGAGLLGEAVLPEQQDAAKQAVQVFRDLNTDQNTDYVLALQFAVSYFRDRPTVPPTCDRVVWFTDGAYSIDKTDAPGLATYTTSRDKGTIQDQLGAQICGPLPDGSQLGASVSGSIREAGFSVQMIDLRNEASETASDRSERARTAPVIERLLGDDRNDPCHVAGGRVEAGRASALETEFFKQGQIALGHFELDCAQLTDGYPASMVNALAVKNSAVDEKTQIVLDGRTASEGQGFADYAPRSGPAQSGTISVRSGSGRLESCFADLQARVVLQGDASVFGKAGQSFLNYTVFGAGDGAGGSGIASSAVKLEATVDGKPTQVEWNGDSRSWRVSIDGPRDEAPAVVVSARATGWQGPSFEAPVVPVQLRGEPPVPRISWSGPTSIEGKKEVAGRLKVSPAAQDTGGTLCVTFGQPVSTVESLSLTLSSPDQLCRSDVEPFDLPAVLTTTSSSNTTGRISLTYTTTYTPEGSSTPIKIGGTENVDFPPISLVKPADGGRIILVSAVLWAVSMLLSYGLLVGLTNRDLRLPDPKDFRSISIPLVLTDSGLRRADDAPPRMEDFNTVSGDRSEYLLDGGMSFERRRTWNPYSRLSAYSRSQTGGVATQPSITRGFGRRVESATPFDEMVWVTANPVTKDGTAVALVRRGVRAEVASEAIDRALLVLQRQVDTLPAAQSIGSGAQRSDGINPSQGASRSAPGPTEPGLVPDQQSERQQAQVPGSVAQAERRVEPKLPPRPAGS